MEKLEWSALEYEKRERGTDWFWALGIIVATSSIASIIFGNYFFAALLILSGVMLTYFATKTPEAVPYELNNKGLKIRSRIYPYENIKSFWVQVGQVVEIGQRSIIHKPTLFIKTERAFMPVISIPIENEIAEDIHSIMISKDIEEEEMKEHPAHTIMESLGF